MKKIASLFGPALALSLIATPASANEKLFKDYAYGAPASEFSAQPGYYDCSADVAPGAICLDDVEFVDSKFTAALVFSGDKLYMLSLIREYDNDTYTKAMGALAQSFSLIAMADASSQLDIVDLARKSSNAEEFTAAINSYESVGLNAGNLTYSFIEGPNLLARKHANATAALASVPDSSRSADLVVFSEGVESAMVLRFTFPKLEAKKVEQAMAAPAEKF